MAKRDQAPIVYIIDWVNVDADKLYGISKVMENIKAELGRGIAVVTLQKGVRSGKT